MQQKAKHEHQDLTTWEAEARDHDYGTCTVRTRRELVAIWAWCEPADSDDGAAAVQVTLEHGGRGLEGTWHAANGTLVGAFGSVGAGA